MHAERETIRGFHILPWTGELPFCLGADGVGSRRQDARGTSEGEARLWTTVFSWASTPT